MQSKMKFFLIGVLAIFILSIAIGSIEDPADNVNSEQKTETVAIDEATIIFDAMQYWKDNNTTISENELVELLGEPDSIDEWNYKSFSKVYPIRQLNYGNYEYLFNNDLLQRINIYEEISYKNVDDILGMFGLKEYSNTEIVNNNVSYRATNCGVHDLWIPSKNEDSFDIVKITYGTIWE